ncbi:putative deaminase [Pseudocercospora fuligena]|uniref:Adenosine deaminase n=1 Tax=Pseudocercospora fuligena TaxID=685502 RepID=A0A8H6R603_9PEZI|nr:putative deaminase [Pseudocercospora fuligena]
MEGFREASIEAEKELNLKSSWIMCFMRDESPESAMECYEAALPYRDMIIGIGLDSNEDNRPPNLFKDVFSRAKKDGYKLTCHCDIGRTYPVEHIRQVIEDIRADRIDHGLNIVEDTKLMDSVKEKGLGMTICPWSYIRHQPFAEVWETVRKIFDAGIKISIGSDDPAFMEDTWVLENFRILKKFCGFSNGDVVRLMRGAMEMSWASPDVKEEMIAELEKTAIEGDHEK